MLPADKANELKNYFKSKCTVSSESGLKLIVTAYIERLLDDFYFKPGSYEMEYSYEWKEYKSYWEQVLKNL